MAIFDESALLDLWCQILGLDATDRATSFADLGGTSIAAEQLAARITDWLGIHVSGLDILSEESFAALADQLRARMARGES